MPITTFGDPAKVAPKRKRSTRKRAEPAPAQEERIIPPALLPDTPAPELPETDARMDKRVLTAIITLAQLVETRHALASAMEAVREIDLDALDDPANADHPQLPAMRQLAQQRLDEERALWIRALELGGGLAGIWQHLGRDERIASGLATIIEANANEDKLVHELWYAGTALDRLAPLPEPWAVPSDLAHMIGRLPGSIVIWDRETLERIGAEYPPF